MVLKNSQSAVSRTVENLPREPVLLAAQPVVRKPACDHDPRDWTETLETAQGCCRYVGAGKSSDQRVTSSAGTSCGSGPAYEPMLAISW